MMMVMVMVMVMEVIVMVTVTVMDAFMVVTGKKAKMFIFEGFTTALERRVTASYNVCNGSGSGYPGNDSSRFNWKLI